MKCFCIVAWLALMLVATSGTISAQSREISRLRTQLRSFVDRRDLVPDTAYADTLNRLAHAYYGVNADSAFFYARKALEYSGSAGYAQGEAEGWRML